MADAPKIHVDAAGRRHRPASGPVRLVSLAPPLTELCFALEIGDSLVGRTDRCRRNGERLTAVTSVGGPAALKADKLAGLDPTHVLIDLDTTPPATLARLDALEVEIVAVRIRKPSDNFDLYTLFGNLFGAVAAADTLARRFELALARVKMAVRKKTVHRVLYLVDKNPYRTVAPDSYATALLALIRLEPVSAAAAEDGRGAVIEITDSLLMSVEKVLFSGASGAFKRSDLKLFATGHGIDRSKLLRLDGALSSWYGARAIGAMDDLIALREAVDS